MYSKLRLLPPSSNKKEKPEYLAYLKQVLNMGGQLHWCGLSLSELAHLIEGTEFDIYRNTHPTSVVTQAKEYRHNLTNERASVVNEIKLTRLPLLGQRSDYFRGVVLRISTGFRQFTPQNGV